MGAWRGSTPAAAIPANVESSSNLILTREIHTRVLYEATIGIDSSKAIVVVTRKSNGRNRRVFKSYMILWVLRYQAETDNKPALSFPLLKSAPKQHDFTLTNKNRVAIATKEITY
jgi:hypothetical protein